MLRPVLGTALALLALGGCWAQAGPREPPPGQLALLPLLNESQEALTPPDVHGAIARAFRDRRLAPRTQLSGPAGARFNRMLSALQAGGEPPAAEWVALASELEADTLFLPGLRQYLQGEHPALRHDALNGTSVGLSRESLVELSGRAWRGRDGALIFQGRAIARRAHAKTETPFIGLAVEEAAERLVATWLGA